MPGYIKKPVKDWAVFVCKDDTLYNVPKAHSRATTHFFITPCVYKHGIPRSTLQGAQLIFSGLFTYWRRLNEQ